VSGSRILRFIPDVVPDIETDSEVEVVVSISVVSYVEIVRLVLYDVVETVSVMVESEMYVDVE
jgi:hypothetical protein